MRLLVPPMVVLAALSFTACGGGSSSTSTTVTETVASGSQELTKAEWIEKADAICTDFKAKREPAEAEVHELQQMPETSETLGKMADAVRAEGKTAEEETAKLRELVPPAEDREVVGKMLSAVDANSVLAENFAVAIENDVTTEIESLGQQLKENSIKAKGLAQGYGLKVCGADQ